MLNTELNKINIWCDTPLRLVFFLYVIYLFNCGCHFIMHMAFWHVTTNFPDRINSYWIKLFSHTFSYWISYFTQKNNAGWVCKQHSMCYVNAWRAWKNTETVTVDQKNVFQVCPVVVDSSGCLQKVWTSLKTPQAFLQLIFTKQQTKGLVLTKDQNCDKNHWIFSYTKTWRFSKLKWPIKEKKRGAFVFKEFDLLFMLL